MKKYLATGLLVGLAWGAMGGQAQAATSLSIQGVDATSGQVTIAYSDGRIGDWYHVYSNDKVLFNTLNADDVAAGKKTIDLQALGAIQLGDEIRVELRSHTFPEYLHARELVGGQVAQPEKMTINTRSTLLANGSSQHLGLQITGPYSPDAKDVVRVTPYNAANTVQGNVQYFAIPAAVIADSDTLFSLPLAPSQDVVRYDIEIVRNGQVLASQSYLFNGAGGSNQAEESSLRLQFPATVRPGQTVQGKVFMTDSTGKEVDITGLAAFGITGPVDQASIQQGTFNVADQAVPGQSIRVVASLGSQQASQDIPIEGSTANPLPQTPQGDVIMTIDSRTFLVNGQAKETEVAPFIQDNRTFVPIRALAESFGATVEFDPQTMEIRISQGNRQVVMVANSKTYTVNGVNKTMDVAPYIAYSGRTIVPVRFAAEALGYDIRVTTIPGGGTKDIIFTNTGN